MNIKQYIAKLKIMGYTILDNNDWAIAYKNNQLCGFVNIYTKQSINVPANNIMVMKHFIIISGKDNVGIYCKECANNLLDMKYKSGNFQLMYSGRSDAVIGINDMIDHKAVLYNYKGVGLKVKILGKAYKGYEGIQWETDGNLYYLSLENYNYNDLNVMTVDAQLNIIEQDTSMVKVMK